MIKPEPDLARAGECKKALIFLHNLRVDAAAGRLLAKRILSGMQQI